MINTIKLVFKPGEPMYNCHVYINNSTEPLRFTPEAFIAYYCSLFYRDYDSASDFNLCAAYAFRSLQVAVSNIYDQSCWLVPNSQPLATKPLEEPRWFKDLNLFQNPPDASTPK